MNVLFAGEMIVEFRINRIRVRFEFCGKCAWEDAAHVDVGLWQLLMDRGAESLDSHADLGSRIEFQIVRANQQHDCLGLEGRKLAVVDTPQYIFHPIPAKAKIRDGLVLK